MITTEDGHMLTTVGLDLGDKTIQACFLDHHGEIVRVAKLGGLINEYHRIAA